MKPLTTKAYDRRASGDCGTSGFGSHTHSCFAGDTRILRNAATIVNKNLSIYLTKLAKDFLKNSCSVLKWSIWRSLYIT